MRVFQVTLKLVTTNERLTRAAIEVQIKTLINSKSRDLVASEVKIIDSKEN